MHYGWTLDKAAWTKLITATRGRSVAKSEFQQIGESPGADRGRSLRFLCKADGRSVNATQRHLLRTLVNAVYVGQAMNLRQRFDDHLRAPMDPMVAARAVFSTTLEFWFTRASSDEEMCQLESLLIECLGPPANRQSGPTLKATLGVGRPA